MKPNTTVVLDWMLFISFTVFLYMAVDILPAIWSVLNLITGKNIEYFPGIFIAIPLFLLLFYTVFIRKQQNTYCYVWYIILTVGMVQIYYMIEGPYNRMHIFLYFMVSILFFRMLHHYLHDNRLYFFGFLMAVSFGVFDECLQFFSANRGFSLSDIKADALAALLGQMFLMLVVRPDLRPSIPRLKSKVKRYYVQEEWLKRQR